ncbi:MAG: AAA-associated domain-containing protein [Pyrobaculum sp.]
MRFPPVGVDQVLGLLKVIRHLGGRVDVMNINEAVDADLGDLSHAVDAAELLGLVKTSGGDVELTEEGLRAVEAPLKSFQLSLRSKLAGLEPFKSLVEYIGKGEEVTVAEALEYVEQLGYDEEGAKKIINWAVFAQLVEIDDGEYVRPA